MLAPPSPRPRASCARRARAQFQDRRLIRQCEELIAVKRRWGRLCTARIAREDRAAAELEAEVLDNRCAWLAGAIERIAPGTGEGLRAKARAAVQLAPKGHDGRPLAGAVSVRLAWTVIADLLTAHDPAAVPPSPAAALAFGPRHRWLGRGGIASRELRCRNFYRLGRRDYQQDRRG